MAQPLTNTQKIATLLVSLGAERSARILEYLEPAQIARIAQEIAVMGKVPPQVSRAVLREFRSLMHAHEQDAAGINFAENVLDKTLGTERAHAIIQQIKPLSGPKSPALLTTITPDRAAALVASEPVPIIARLLITLPPEHAAAIIGALPEGLQPLVALQLSTTPRPSPEVRAQLEKAIRAKAARHTEVEEVSGKAALFEMLQNTASPQPQPAAPPVPPPPSPPAMAPAVAPDPQAMEREDGLVFADLNLLRIEQLQALVGQVGNRDLSVALRAAEASLRDRILEALPFGRRVTLQTRLKSRQTIPLRAIEEAQERILDFARTALIQAKLDARAARRSPHV